MELYSYGPLERQSQIRVLQLLPGSDDAPLVGYLEHVDLDIHSSYKCLSYTWGEPVFTHGININGKVLKITSNLETALRRLRARDRLMQIWIDAICIDQTNLIERNQQVPLMRRIYSTCEECVIYLGEECDNSEIMPSFFQELYNGFVDLYLGRIKMPLFRKVHPRICAPDEPAWNAFRLFMTRPWFRRVWIVQEFALSKRVTMVCGEWAMDATVPGSLLLLYRILGLGRLDSPGHDRLALQGMRIAAQNMRMRFDCGNSAPMLDPQNPARRPTPRSLHSLLEMTRRCDSYDPRDRVYGILGLATDLDSSNLEVDYARGLVEINLDVASHLINQGEGYHMLQSIQCPIRIDDEWPSWLPVWTSCEPNSFRPGKRKRFDSPNHQLHPNLPVFCLQRAQRTLIIQGYILDAVGELGPKRERSTPHAEQAGELRQIESLAAGSKILRNDQKQPDSVWRTISGNATDFGISPLPPEYAAKYKHFKEKLFGHETAAKARPRDLGEAEYFEQLRTDILECGEFAICWIELSETRFCVTKSGMMALIPREAEVGDLIFIVLGDPSHSTHVIRRRADSNHYTWIGQSYVHCVLGDEYRAIEEGEPCEILVR